MHSATKDIHKDLVKKVKESNRSAQFEIYQLYAKPMYNTALRILCNSQEAEDVVQESFIDMFKNINSFREESTFGAWFKRIVTNKAINQLRKKRYFIDELDGVADVVEEKEEVESADFPYTVNDVNNAVKMLKPGFRAVFSLYMFENYTHQEIANALEISLGTSKSQLSRAKLKVREIIFKNKKVS